MKGFRKIPASLCGFIFLFIFPVIGLAATFPGIGVGPIPDGQLGTPPNYGTPQVINFNVTGLSAPIQQLSVSLTMTHTWAGDVDVVLAGPGGTPTAQIVGHVGVITPGAFGDNSNYGGTYLFSDVGAEPQHFWTVATAPTCGDDCIIAPGTYRASARGQSGQTNPPPVVNLTAAFASVIQLNGTWTLTIRDGGNEDTGTTSAASLNITAGGDPFPGPPVDMDGDGRTDFVVVRNTGGGPNGQVEWFTKFSGSAGARSDSWGLASDFFLPGDFDGDGKSDIAVWRPNGGIWYVLQSATGTIRIDQLGHIGDNPTVIGDYNGDGKDDIALYRSGASTGMPSYWFYRTTSGSDFSTVQWGQHGDYPGSGDYDGDGRTDIVIQRADASGGARFWRLLSGGSADSVVFGLPTDIIIPGDFDGDGKADLAIARSVSGELNWYYQPSSGGAVVQTVFGYNGWDTPVPGNYDADGKTDIAVWRFNTGGGQGSFIYKKSTDATTEAFSWGKTGDYPVANSYVH